MALIDVIKGRFNKAISEIRGINRAPIQFGAGIFISILLLSWLRIRPLGVILLGLLGFWFYRTRCNLRIIASPEIQQNFKNIIERLRDYRQTQPSSFVAVTSICLLALAVLGHLVSGSTVVLIGLTLAAIVSTKYNIIIVKHEKKEYGWSNRLQPDVDLDEEFLPEANENNLCVLQRASDLATLSCPTEVEGEDEEKSDEVPSEFLMEEVPEVNENTSDEDHDVDDLLPVVRNGQHTSEADLKITNVDLSKTDAILFKNRHFKDDSYSLIDTSSSEESLSKGLVFPDHTEVDSIESSRAIHGIEPHNLEASDLIATAVKAQTQALIANSGKIIPNLVSNLVQWSNCSGNRNDDVVIAKNSSQPNTQSKSSSNRRVVTSLDSSDESDFEILQNDDFM